VILSLFSGGQFKSAKGGQFHRREGVSLDWPKRVNMVRIFHNKRGRKENNWHDK
jgi:hypothetical protein